jgi:hypothetical protein
MFKLETMIFNKTAYIHCTRQHFLKISHLRRQKVFVGDQVAEGVTLIDADDAEEEIDELVPQPVLFQNHLGVGEDEIVVHAFVKNGTG